MYPGSRLSLSALDSDAGPAPTLTLRSTLRRSTLAAPKRSDGGRVANEHERQKRAKRRETIKFRSVPCTDPHSPLPAPKRVTLDPSPPLEERARERRPLYRPFCMILRRQIRQQQRGPRFRLFRFHVSTTRDLSRSVTGHVTGWKRKKPCKHWFVTSVTGPAPQEGVCHTSS